MYSKGNYEPVENLPEISGNNKTIDVRFYNDVKYSAPRAPAESHWISKSPAIEAQLSQVFSKMKAFNKVEISSFESDSIYLEYRNKDLQKYLIDRPIALSKADFFVDFQFDSNSYHDLQYSDILLPFAVVSLGVIPFCRPEKINIKATVYNHRTGSIKDYSIINEVWLWNWTPLIVVSSASFIGSDRASLYEQRILVTLQNLIKQMLKEGAFNDSI